MLSSNKIKCGLSGNIIILQYFIILSEVKRGTQKISKYMCKASVPTCVSILPEDWFYTVKTQLARLMDPIRNC